MRTEQEMYDLIIRIAKEEKRILAVYMNGSRTNENAVKDIFRDYDIVYVVKETASFREDKEWIDLFGERLYMQYPDEFEGEYGCKADADNCYGWLMQLADGNRVDLHVQTLEYAREEIKKDKLCKILLDKGEYLPAIPEATDEDYWIKCPSQKRFLEHCNEFFWCLNNVAKGLWRGEIPYVQDMVNLYIRPELVQMLSFQIGLDTNFTCSIGKSGKYMYKWLPQETWEKFLDTYAGGDAEEIWTAVFTMCELFDETAKAVSSALGYDYDCKEAKASVGFLKHVRQLPKDAREIFE